MADDNIVHDGTFLYEILNPPIGTWGSDNSLSIHEAIILPGPPSADNIPPGFRVAMKMVNEDQGRNHVDMAVHDIQRSNYIKKRAPKLILGIESCFRAFPNDVHTLFIVLPFDPEVVSLRSLMSSRQNLTAGISPKCIALSLGKVLFAVGQIHHADDLHRQITSGNIYYHHQEKKIKLAYAASVYERNPNQEQEPPDLCPINRLLDWGRAPEVMKYEDPDADSLYINETRKSDIWLIGIAALELAYGKIQVSNREELLAMARYISTMKQLPNTWEELRMKIAKKEGTGVALAMTLTSSDKKRFSDAFVNFVARCLATDPARRPSVGGLLWHDFIDKTVTSMEYFKNVMLRGWNPFEAHALMKKPTPSERIRFGNEISHIKRKLFPR